MFVCFEPYQCKSFQVEVYGAIEGVGGGQNILFCPLWILSFVWDNRLGWGCGAAHNMI